MSSNNSKTTRSSARRGTTSSSSSSNSNNMPTSSSSQSQSSPTRPQRPTRATVTSSKPVIIDSSDSNESDNDDTTTSNKRNNPSQPTSKTTRSSQQPHQQQRGGAASGAAAMVDPEKLARLESITGLSKAECMQLLEACQGKIEKAIEMHFSNDNEREVVASSKTNNKNNASSSSSLMARNVNNKRPIGGGGGSHEDGGGNEEKPDEDEVRAPIPIKSEKLLNYDPYALNLEPKAKRTRSVFDGNHDHFNEMTTHDGAPSSSNSSKLKSLAALYRAPIEILFKGSFEASKIQGTRTNKWLIINVQKQDDFTSQCLNRDLWRVPTVQEIIKANFIFVQIYSDSIEGKKLLNYYRINSFPFVAILDPRTGENVLTFNSSKLDQLMFCEKVTNFLCDSEAPIKDFQPPSEPITTTKAASNNIVIDDDDNDEKNSNDVDVVEVDDDLAKKSDVIVVNGGSKSSIFNKSPTKKPPSTTQKANDILKYFESKSNDAKNSTTPAVTTQKTKSSIDNHSAQKETKTSRVKKIESSDDDDEVILSGSSSQTSSDEDKKSKINANSSPQTNGSTDITKDCMIRVMCPNGERIDFATNGDCQFKQLVEHLKTKGYKKKAYELIERLMPNITTLSSSTSPSKKQQPTQSQSLSASESSTKISNDFSNLVLTCQSRNLFNLNDSSMSFKKLNLYPRVFLLLQEIC